MARPKNLSIVRRTICAIPVLLVASSVRAAYEVPNPAYAPPTTYYSTATGTGLTLRTNLHNIISANFTMRSYGDSRYAMATKDVNGTFKVSIDQDPNNPNNIILIYNHASIPGTWDAGATWNREHVWPKFWLDVTSDQVSNTYKGPASDLFELRPSNPNVNSGRSNDGYGYYPYTSSTYGANTNSGTTYWYPGPADTGDVARTIFYMATRYFDPTNSNRGTDIQNLDIKNGAPTKFNMGDLNSLLHWNYSDGVDNLERARNQYIYGSAGNLTNHALNPNYYQGNRNPFIDHPEYVWAIFGGGVNNSQISVGTPAADGSSSTTVDLGKAIVGATLPNGSVVVNKTGVDPTTFDITGSDVSTPVSSALQIGAGQPFDYNNVTKTMSFSLTASTATVGDKSGSITLNNTDLTTSGAGHGSADGDDIVNVTATVVDHSNASFSTASDVNAQSIDFGYVPQGFAARTASFAVTNLAAASGYTADLALNSISASGSSSFTTNASAFGHLAAGAQNSYAATLDTSAAGALSAVHTLAVSDEAIPGATSNTSLALTMNARVLSSASFPVTGFIQLNNGETYNTGAFSIAAGQTLTKTGAGTMNITGAQFNGAASSLAATDGAVSLATDAGSPAVFSLALSATNASVIISSPQHLANLTVGSNSLVTVAGGGVNLLVSKGLSINSQGALDLNDNDAIVDATPAMIAAYLQTGRAGGAWNGFGLQSTAAANDPHHLAAFGWAPESIIGSTFDGQPVDSSAVVLKYTQYGDANLDGTIGPDDYALIDRGIALQLAGWVDGDFDYSGTIDAGDYLLLDESYGFQTGVLSPTLLADREARFGEAYVSQLVAVVPEPALAGISALVLLAMRRRRAMLARYS